MTEFVNANFLVEQHDPDAENGMTPITDTVLAEIAYYQSTLPVCARPAIMDTIGGPGWNMDVTPTVRDKALLGSHALLGELEVTRDGNAILALDSLVPHVTIEGYLARLRNHRLKGAKLLTLMNVNVPANREQYGQRLRFESAVLLSTR